MVSPLLSRSLASVSFALPAIPDFERVVSRETTARRGAKGGGEMCKGRRRRKPRPEITASIPSRLSCSTLSDSRWNQFRSLSPSYASRFASFPAFRTLRQGDLDGFTIITQSHDLIARMNLRECRRMQTSFFFLEICTNYTHICTYKYIFLYHIYIFFCAYHVYCAHYFLKRQLRFRIAKLSFHFFRVREPTVNQRRFVLFSHQTGSFTG